MNTEEYVGMEFRDFIEKFNLSDDEFIRILEIHIEESPLKMVRIDDEICVF